MGPRVAVLLATYNGERFLDELLDSVLGQSYPNFHVYARDDGSSDGTPRILERREGAQLTVLRDAAGRQMAAGSFLRLLEEVRADIYMFCDQDDVWHREKVAEAVERIVAAGLDRQVLFHSDLTVVDEHRQEIASSFHRHEGLSLPGAQRLSRLVVQNCVVGCTVAVSEALVAGAGIRERPPESMAMHDWWLALYAACFGRIEYSARSRILYRQHGANVSGAGRRSFWERVRLQLSAAGVQRIREYMRRVGRQADAFAAYYADRLPPAAVADLTAAASLARGSGLTGVIACSRRGIRLQNAYMNLAIVASALASPFVRTSR